MTEVAKGKANLSQKSSRGNYRAATAHDMDEVYSRNIAQQRHSVSDFAQGDFERGDTLESIKEDSPIFLENRLESEMSSFETEFHGLKPDDLSITVLSKRGMRAS